MVHLESGDDILIMEGLVDIVKSAPTLKRYADEYYAKYKFKPRASFDRFKPTVMLAWREKDDPKSATRWKF